MMPQNRPSRLPGLLYLIVVVTGLFSLLYVPAQLRDAAGPATVWTAITAHTGLFRQGIASLLVNQVAFLLLPLALYPRLRPFGGSWAAAMVALAVPSVPITLLGVVHRLDALSVVAGSSLAAQVPAEQLRGAAALALETYGNGLLVASLFWGLWLLPFGLLAYRARLVPRLLAVFLMLGCAGYLATVFGTVLVPGFEASQLAGLVRLPAAIGEIGTCLWLLLAGARPAPPASLPA